MNLIDTLKYSSEYQAIYGYYKGKFARKSGLPYIRHIDQGISIMEMADEYLPEYKNCQLWTASAAFCIHPLMQEDPDLLNILQGSNINHFDAKAVAFAIEYRAIANHYLPKYMNNGRTPYLSVIPEVNLMLIADKIQNRYDYDFYSRKIILQENPQLAENLDVYFLNWITLLGITPSIYNSIINRL